jgi:hypothetical protein
MQAASQWLGKSGRKVAGVPAAEMERLLQAPNHYGFHATIKPPFRLKTGNTLNDVEKELAAFTKELQPIFLPPLEIARIDNFFCLRPVSDSEAVHNLAAEAVQRFDHFRRPAEEKELARRRAAGLSDRQEHLLLTWGYPYVLDEFRFHLTLTGNIENERMVEPLRRELSSRFTPVIQEPVCFDGLCLFVQQGDSAFSEYIWFPFGG